MKRLLVFWFFCVSLRCFGMLSEEQIQEIDRVGWPEDMVRILHRGTESDKEDFFKRAFEKVEKSRLSDEQKVYRYIFILANIRRYISKISAQKFYEFLTSPKYFEQIVLYLLNYVEDPEAAQLKFDVIKYRCNRDKILTALRLLAKNEGSLLDRELLCKIKQLKASAQAQK